MSQIKKSMLQSEVMYMNFSENQNISIKMVIKYEKKKVKIFKTENYVFEKFSRINHEDPYFRP